MKKIFSLAMVVGWVTALSLAGPAKAQGNMEIATWAGFRNAVAVFTFDDGCANQLSIAVPIFDNYGELLPGNQLGVELQRLPGFG